MYYSPMHQIHDDHEFVLAPIKRRFLAFFIDWIILVLLYLAIVILFSLINKPITNINVHGIFDVELEIKNVHPFFITVLKIFLGLLPIIYFTLSMFISKGRTLGKFFLRIKVVSLYHEQPGLWHCIERSLGYFASALEFGFGYLQAFWNPNRMSLHDKIAETIVIRLPGRKKIRKTVSGK